MPEKDVTTDVAAYLQRRLEYLVRCNAEINDKLGKEMHRVVMQKREEADEDHETHVAQMFHHLQYVVGNTFRYTMLVAICSFLEEALRVIASHVVPNYEKELKGKGSWFDKHMRLLQKWIPLDCATIERQCNHFRDVITLRNAVVHAWGKVAETLDPEAVRGAAERCETVEMFRDGYLYFGDQVVPNAVIAAEEILERVLADSRGCW